MLSVNRRGFLATLLAIPAAAVAAAREPEVTDAYAGLTRCGFARDVLGVEPAPWQEDVLTRMDASIGPIERGRLVCQDGAFRVRLAERGDMPIGIVTRVDETPDRTVVTGVNYGAAAVYE